MRAISVCNRPTGSLLLSIAVVLLIAVIRRPAHAEVIIDWVTIGDAGNPGDPIIANPALRHGAVNYEYRIGKYEVTNAQYSAFLNAKASRGGLASQLYKPGMAIDLISGGIQRSGSGTIADPWVYLPNVGYENYPVAYMDLRSALRFVNWLNNGQGDADTETGAYAIPPEFTSPVPEIVRNPDAKV